MKDQNSSDFQKSSGKFKILESSIVPKESELEDDKVSLICN